ncbi:MAG: hypothetical protein IJU48_02200 [Synergistaceae bacterium]|nr:hypothetical protein [Synergistaceae bacterium]
MKSRFDLFKASTIRYFQIVKNYYQLPTPSWLKTYERDKCKVFQTCDIAGSMKSSADYFVLGTFALCPDGELLVLDIFREHLNGPDQPALMLRKFQEWKPSLVGVEDSEISITMYQLLRQMDIPIIELNSDADKYTRAIPAAARYEAGMMYHLENTHWLIALEAELLSFPNGMHDDQVDVISYAVFMQSWGYFNKKKTGGRALALG